MTKYRFSDCVDIVGEACKKYDGDKKGSLNNHVVKL